MIVPMKKISLVMLDSGRRASLAALRELGVLHLQIEQRGSETLEELEEKRSRLVRALQLIPQLKKKTAPAADQGPQDDFLLAERVMEMSERERELKEELGRWGREKARLEEWGDFDPEDLAELRERGIHLRLVKMNRGDRETLSEEQTVFTVAESRDVVWAVVAAPERETALPGEELAVPAVGLSEVNRRIRGIQEELVAMASELEGYVVRRKSVESTIARYDDLLEFERAGEGMTRDGMLAHVTGYAPVESLDAVRRAAARKQWALLIEEPDEEDPVPTLVRNPKWIRIISPVLDFLGTLPGYREYDISMWFLLFFSIFFAMIIGDAGYGCIFLLLTIVARAKFRRAPPQIFFLLFVTSLCTVVWGAITGTWFGVQGLVESGSALSSFVIDPIASFPPQGVDAMKNVMHLCFLIGGVQLSVAHIKNLVKKLPRLAAYAELGWLAILWGMYFLIRLIVLENGDFGVLQSWLPGPWLLLGGLLFIVLFDEQQGRFLRGVGLGLAKLPLKLLDSIGSFSDIISYVRLFAVGLASVEVAKAFNSLAMDMGLSLPAGLGAAFILFFGHALNIVMGALSLIVHGVRLNMLEFSGHLNMEWTGIPYKPFRDNEVGQTTE